MIAALGVVAALIVTPTVSADSLADTALRDTIKQYVSAQGPVRGDPTVILADMGGDAALEAVVSFCIDENAPGGSSEGASNPANAWCAVSVFSKSGGAWKHTARADLGQGEVKGAKAGVVTVESVTYAKDDPLCCPSVRKTLHLGLRRGQLVDLARPTSRVGRKGR
jgi:hypothetical protein